MSLPAFRLTDSTGAMRVFPASRPALLCFVKEDCPTCALVYPLLVDAARVFGAAVEVMLIGQTGDGNATLAAQYPGAPVADDSALKVSFGYGIEAVPTLILAGANGAEQKKLVGFEREGWRALFNEIAAISGRPFTPDWAAFPAWRPGCGSKTEEPEIRERLEADARGERMRARTIEIPEADDPFEFMFEQGLTDDLPVIPPTRERVGRMLTGTARDPQEIVAIMPPNQAPATVEKIAINAVMAGCRPEYLPVVLAAIEAVCDEAFNIHGINATTWGITPCLIVSGPVRKRLDINAGVNALGQGHRANATIGRAIKLALRNIGGAKPGGIEQATLGSPAKYTFCFVELEEGSPWPSLAVERGFAPGADVVTCFAAEAPRFIADQGSRTARQLAASLGLAVEACMHPRLRPYGDAVLVICPEHAEVFRRDGWSKADLRARIQEVTSRPLRDVLRDAECGEGVDPRAFGPDGPTATQLEQRLPKFASAANIHIVVAGGAAGKFSAVLGGWGVTAGRTALVSRRI